MDENDICYECMALGYDYYVNEKGEFLCVCDECSANPNRVREGEQDERQTDK